MAPALPEPGRARTAPPRRLRRERSPWWASALASTALALMALCALLALCACAGRPADLGGAVEENPQRGAALLSLAEGHHKRADIALRQGQRDDAKAEMNALLDTAEPLRGAAAESYDVIFDGATRLARMHLEDEALDEAEQVARRGLVGEAEAPPSLFRGYLHQVLADILEKRGDLRGAVEQHGEAIVIFKAILDAAPAPATPPTPRE